MNISEHFKKPFWVRKINQGEIKFSKSLDCVNYVYPSGQPMDGECYLTQTDFACEINPEAHEVNSQYVSRRPIMEPDGETKDGKTKWRVKGYEPLERICFGKQHEISVSKADFFGNFWIANETEKRDLFETFQSYKESVGLDVAFHALTLSCFTTGDGAILLLRRGNNIEYKIFSNLFGDELYTDIDGNRNPVLYRKYLLNGRNAVDIYSVEYHETWVQDFDSKSESDTKWYNKVKDWFKELGTERSEDGWRLISRTKSQVKGYNQATYWRVPDIPSGVAQQSIDTLERTCSFLLEEFKEFAAPTLVMKAAKINRLPAIGAHHRVLGIKGTADELGKSDVKSIMPPDGSNLAEKSIDTLIANINHSTMSVTIDSDIFRAADPSSSAIRILFNSETQWCRSQEIHFHSGLKDMLEVFKQLVGQQERALTDYAELRISCGFEVKLPQNQTEVEKRILDKVYARVMSRESAIQELGSPYLGDYEKIRKEWEEEIDMKARIPKVADAQVSKEYGLAAANDTVVIEDGNNPNKPKIDNSSQGKSIAD